MLPDLARVLTPRRRFWLYLVWAAAVPLAGGYGLLSDSTAPLWLALGSALFIGPLAASNVPAAPDAATPVVPGAQLGGPS